MTFDSLNRNLREKRVQVDLRLDGSKIYTIHYTPIVPIEHIMKILFSLSPFAIIIEVFLHSMENAVSSTRKSNISTATKKKKKITKKTHDGWPSTVCLRCYYVMNELYMNFSLFSASFFFVGKVFKCVYRFNWTNWTMFIHINHIYQVPTASYFMLSCSMCCMLFACCYNMHMCVCISEK